MNYNDFLVGTSGIEPPTTTMSKLRSCIQHIINQVLALFCYSKSIQKTTLIHHFTLYAGTLLVHPLIYNALFTPSCIMKYTAKIPDLGYYCSIKSNLLPGLYGISKTSRKPRYALIA